MTWHDKERLLSDAPPTGEPQGDPVQEASAASGFRARRAEHVLAGDDRGSAASAAGAEAPPNSAVHFERADTVAGSAAGADSLRRIERQLDEIRSRVEALTREDAHQEFSPARLAGTMIQVFAIGALLFALADVVFDRDRGAQLVKLALAGVLQVGALTAFVLASRR